MIKNPYKITYISLDSNFDNEPHKQLQQDIKNIKNTLSKEDSYDYNQLLDLLKIKNKELYRKNTGFNLHHYIFIGTINTDIQTILIKIETTMDYPAKTDLDSLNTFFGYNCREIWGDFKKYTSIKFIESYIREDDTLSSIKITLCSKLQPYLPNDDIFMSEQIYLTCKLDVNSYMYLYDDVKTPDVLPEDIIIQSIIKKILQKRIKLNYQNIKFELLSFGYNDEESKLFLEKYLNDISSLDLNSIAQDIQLKIYLNNFIVNPLLTHSYYTYNKINIYINNFLLHFLDKEYEGYDILLNTIKNTLDESNNNKILNSFGNIENNELFVYNFRNIHNYTITKKLFNLDDLEDTNKYFNGFITKFFPKITNSNYASLLSKKIIDDDYSETLKMYNKVIDTKTSLFSIIDDRYNYLEDLDIRISHTTYNQTIISHNLNLPLDLDLVRLFNELDLSFTLPFVKLKDPNTKNSVYKLYKAVTKKIDNKLPEVSKNVLLEWIDINSYECVNGIFTPIKGLPKFINYKIKLIDLLLKNTINKGVIIKLNYDNSILVSLDVQVEDIVYVINIEFVKNVKSTYKIDDKIEFYSSDTLYADIEITKKGWIELKINYKNSNYLIDNSILIKIIAEFNKFIDKIKNIDYFKSYTNIILPINSDLLTLNPTFYNTLFSYNNISLDLELGKDIEITYDGIKNLAVNFFPYLSVRNELFYKDQNIEFFNETVDGNIWIDAKITNIHEDDTYSILVSDVIKGTKITQTVDSKFIRIKGDVNYRKYINLVYKRISDFNEQPPIKQLIYKLYKQNQSRNIIFNRIIKEYEINVETAKSLINTTIEEDISDLSYNIFQMGINIRFNYLEPLEKDTIKSYKVHIDGYKTVKELDSIKHFLLHFLKTYAIIKNPLLNHSFIDKYSDYIDISTFDKDIIDISDNIEQDQTIKETAVKFSEFDTSWLDEDSDLDSDSDSESEDEQVSILPPPIMSNEFDESKKKDILSDYELVQNETKNPILKRLYDNDNILFDWVSPSNNKRYSKICQSIRYPILISDEKKKFIDEQHPKSYNESLSDIDCSSKTKKDLFNSKTKCSAIKWGSSPENLNWYICPKIWDLQDNVSLNISELEFKGLGHNLSEQEGIALYGDNYLSKDFISNKKKWREDTTKSIIGSKTSKKFPDILEFGPMYKGRGVVSNMKKISSRASLLIEDATKQKRYNYPGFLKSNTHPDGLFVPCCFQGSSKNIATVFGDTEEDVDDSNDYIQGSDKSLGWNPTRIGLLPKELFSYFGMTEEQCKTGSLDIKNKCFLRMGIKQSHNNFFALIASLYPKNLTSDENDILDLILKNITEEEFKTLNKGNLEILFRDNIRYISSFQNYLEYIISDEKKNYKHLYDYLTRPHPWLFKNGLILIILEYKDDAYFLHCPYFMDTSWYDKNALISIAIKTNDVLEPVFLYNKSYQPVRSFNKTEQNISTLFKQIETCIQQSNIKNNPIINPLSVRSNYKDTVDLLKLTSRIQELDSSLNYKIKKYLVDDYNKIIGILTLGNVIIPCTPNVLDEKMIKNEHYIIINELTDLIYGNEMMEHLDRLSKLLNYSINPLKKIVKNDKVISLELETGLIIPTKETEINILYDTSYNELPINKNMENIDSKIKNYSTFYSNKFFISKKTIYDITDIINTIVNVYLDPSKKIEKLYIKQGIVLGVILKNGLLVEIEPITYSDIKIKDIINLDIDEIEKYESDFYVDDYDKTIYNYYELWKFSNYILGVRPIRNIINNKKEVTAILLEQESIIKIKPIFKIFKRKGHNYLINSLIDNDINLHIDDIKPKLYDSVYIDDRIKHIKQIEYKKDLYIKLRKAISTFLQLSENYVIKQFLKEQLNYLGKTITQKRNDIYFIINKLFSLVGDHKLIEEQEFNKLTINNTLPNCLLLNTTKDCKELCTSQDKKHFIQDTDKSLFNKIWLRYYPNYNTILSTKENLTTYLTENTDYAISKNEEDNITNFFEFIYTEALKIEDSDDIIKEKLTQIRTNKTIINTIIENIIKLDYFKCKYNIFTIYKGPKPSNYKSLYDSFLNTFLEEIIRNKFKRSQILDNIKLVDENTKYTHNPNEIIILDTDIEASKITELYLTIKKKYYKNITSYDDAYPIEIKELINSSIHLSKNIKYKISSRDSDLTYSIIKFTNGTKLNKNSTFTAKSKNLSDIDYNYISNYLDLKNTKLKKYPIKSGYNYKYTALEHKKLNKF